MSLFGSDLKKFARHAGKTIAGLVLLTGIALAPHHVKAEPTEYFNEQATQILGTHPSAISIKSNGKGDILVLTKEKAERFINKNLGYYLTYDDNSLVESTEGPLKGMILIFTTKSAAKFESEYFKEKTGLNINIRGHKGFWEKVFNLVLLIFCNYYFINFFFSVLYYLM